MPFSGRFSNGNTWGVKNFKTRLFLNRSTELMKSVLWCRHDLPVLLREELPAMEDVLIYLRFKKLVQYKDWVGNRFWKDVFLHVG